MSKGSTQRPVDKQKFDENFDRIFRKVPKDANLHPSCSEPFCSCMDKCEMMREIKPGDLHK